MLGYRKYGICYVLLIISVSIYVFIYKKATHTTGSLLKTGKKHDILPNTLEGRVKKNTSDNQCHTKIPEATARKTKIVLDHINRIKNCPCNVQLHKEENPLCMTSSSMDFLGVPRFNFLAESVSPCLILRKDADSYYVVNDTDWSMRKEFWRKGGSQQLQLGCLPSVYLLGVGKCGTTFLHNSLRQHKDIRISQRKEMEFWNGGGRWESPFYKDDRKISRYHLFAYISLSKSVAKEISQDIQAQIKGLHDLGKVKKNRLLILDSSTTNVFPEHALKLHALIPKGKAIVILRDPVSREFSAFRYAAQIPGKSKISWFKDQTPQGFHSYVNYSLTKPKTMTFRLSEYSVFVRELLRIFPRENIAFLQYEQFIKDPVGVIESEVLPILKLGPFTDVAKQYISLSFKKNTGRLVYDMLDQTKHFLQKYFTKYNLELSELLNDTKWTWGY